MNIKLTPEAIYNEVISKNLSKNEANELLPLIIEECENDKLRVQYIEVLDKLALINKKTFETLENLLISDNNSYVRSAAAKAIVNNFLKEVFNPLKWTIQHDKSDVVLNTLLTLFENIDNLYTRKLKKELLFSIFGVIQEETRFFLDLDTECSDLGKMSVEFYKTHQTNDDSQKNAIYTINDGHVTALNLAGWTSNLYFKFQYQDTPNKYKNLHENIITIPKSIEKLNHLQILDLNSCRSLISLPDSICNLEALQKLSLYNCWNLQTLPKNIGNLRALQELDLRSCFLLKSLPESICNLKSLRRLKIYTEWSETDLIYPYMNISSLSENLGDLPNLELLEIGDSKNLTNLPANIGNLKSLKRLNLKYLWKLKELPESIGNVETLQTLDLSGCKSLKSLPESVKNLKSLQYLNLTECSELDSIPKCLEKLKNLKIIH